MNFDVKHLDCKRKDVKVNKPGLEHNWRQQNDLENIIAKGEEMNCMRALQRESVLFYGQAKKSVSAVL